MNRYYYRAFAQDLIEERLGRSAKENEIADLTQRLVDTFDSFCDEMSEHKKNAETAALDSHINRLIDEARGK